MSERIIQKNKARTQDEDFDLIKSFLKNADGRTSFNRLVIKYKDMVFNLCFRFIGDYDEANDCAQEIFIKVFNNLKSFKFEAGFNTWLYRISVNTCKNYSASLPMRMKKKTLSLDNSGAESDSSDGIYSKIQAPDNSYSPEKIYERKEREIVIRKAIDSLKGKEKMLVVLRDIEGKSYEEMVEITGLNIGTVKSKLARARQTLRDKLKGVI
jgi:RNA polymerase sigma-70 factor, ECF subfamily